MLGRIVVLLWLVAACSSGVVGNESGDTKKMKFTVQFVKDGYAYDISEAASPADLKGVVANVSVVNDTNAAVGFPCDYLREQGVSVTYTISGLDPYVVGTAPASSSSKSKVARIAPGQSCTVSSTIAWDTISEMLKDAPSGKRVLLIEYSVPPDEVFSEISGASETVVISLR